MFKLGLETESYHLFFQNKKMDIFDFCRKTKELGLDGVQINIIKDYNLDPYWGTLESDDIDHLKKVRKLCDELNLYIEIDTKTLDYDHIGKVLKVCNILDAEVFRTYIPTKEPIISDSAGSEGKYDPCKVRQHFNTSIYPEAIEQLKKLVPILKKHRVKLALENHEYETSTELVDVVQKVDNHWVGLHYDFGNSMMAWEDPIEAAKNMAPYTYTTHLKDHIIIEEPDDVYGYVVSGCPIGDGNLDIKAICDILIDKSPLTRLNIESCYPYSAQFKRAPSTGGVHKVGEGAFKVHDHPYPYHEIKPSQYYYPHEVSEEYLQKLLKDQDEGIKKSVKYVKNIIDSYRQQ